MSMKLYDDPTRIRGQAQNMRFKEFSGIETRPTILEGSDFETRVGSYMPNRLSASAFEQASFAKSSGLTNFHADPQIRDHFAMSMGTIVTADHFQPTVREATNASQIAGDANLAEFGIDNNGEIVIHLDRNGDALIKHADMEWFGYPKGMMGLFDVAYGCLPINNVAIVEDPYTLRDVDAETLQIDPGNGGGSFIDIGGGKPGVVIPYDPAGANTLGTHFRARGGTLGNNGSLTNALMLGVPKIPYGVTLRDVSLDIEGRHLNYSQQLMKGSGGIMFKGRIKIPFIYNNKVRASGGNYNLQMGASYGAAPTNASMFAQTLNFAPTGASAANLFTTISSGYAAVRGKHPFLLIDQLMLDNYFGVGSVPNPNMALEPNRDGKFIIHAPSSTSDCVMARIEAMESRYPKNLNDIVQTFPGSETTGTQTAGIDQYMYKFAKLILRNSDTLVKADYNPETQQGVLNSIQDGLFGYVHIYIDCFSAMNNQIATEFTVMP